MLWLYFIGIFLYFILEVTSWGEKIVGNGDWMVTNAKPCPEQEKYPNYLSVKRSKFNRTHDTFSGKIHFDKDLDGTYAIKMVTCKFVDGGCKLYQVLADDSFEKFAKKFAKSNVEILLTMAKVEPPDFPVPAGDYEVENFLFDYSQLPKEGIYGDFDTDIYLIKDEVDVACIQISASFTEPKD